MLITTKKTYSTPCLCILLSFCFSVLAPYPLWAHENLTVKASLLTDIGDSLKEGWEQTRDGMVPVKEFLKRDWERTCRDFKGISSKLKNLKNSLKSKEGISDKMWEKVESRVMAATDSAMDEVGVTQFGEMLHKNCDGKLGFSPKEVRTDSEEIQKVYIRKSITSLLEKMRTVFEKMSDKDMEKVHSEADRIALELKSGKSLDRVSLGEGMKSKASSTFGESRFSPAQRFFFAALGMIMMVGAVTLPALGIYFLSTNFFGVTASTGMILGSAGAAAALVGFCAAGVKTFENALFNWFDK